jgi:hypothetical protein
MKKNYLFVFMLFALCKFNGHAQLIQNVNIEEFTTIPFHLKNNKIYFQIQLFDENFNVFLDNGFPKTKFPLTIIKKNFTSLPDSLICQTFPKVPDLKDYEKRVMFSIGNYDLILDTIRCGLDDILTLGAELFERRIVNLDFVNETVTLSNALPEDINAYIAIDMSSQKHENRFGVIQHYFLIHIPDFKNSFYQNIPLVFNVDLGAMSSFVPDKTIKKVDYEKFINDPTLLSYLFSNETMFNRPNMRIMYSGGGEVSAFPQEEAFAYFDGWIGVDILKRFHNVIFDYQGKKLYVKIKK